MLLDSREQPRYLGLQEPIDSAAGHIPGAINSFWKESLNANGLWKDADEHVTRFEHLNKEDEIIVYCGSGVTACPNVLHYKRRVPECKAILRKLERLD